jgi:UDP-2,4-diacetamido-2,4,6-trideoxy-beta-L-altropyranose hydrolase
MVGAVQEGTLLIRADGNVAMGTGHVMRCLALAQAWQDCGGRAAVFAMSENTPSLQQRLLDEGMEVERIGAGTGTPGDAEETVRIAERRKADWVVVDGYQFGSDYQSKIKRSGARLLLIDDNGEAGPYTADLVLNQNLHANQSLYASRGAATQLLLGPRYTMLRREFRASRSWRREIAAVARKVLVTMGGSDPDNITATMIAAIQRLADRQLETAVLVGGSNPHLASLKALISSKNLPIRLLVDETNVSEWMTWADVAVASAGTTFWEICFLGLPALLIVLAPNQQNLADTAGRLGLALNLVPHGKLSAQKIAEKLAALLDSEDCRKRQSGSGCKLVDGRGAERVVAFLSGPEVRRARESDCQMFWDWANDSASRAASFRSEAISWDDHVRWFHSKLADPQAFLYTATDKQGTPVGEVRYQAQSRRAVLSINIGAGFRGNGMGQKILTIAIERLFHDSEVEFIDAYVKPGNEPSLKLFAAAGFIRSPAAEIEGQEAVHFVLARGVAA